ncbi:MAG: hypothetical protein IKC35_00190 [Clostridia bacterium]|nr:hypothetical protein [Clostridia bacterium]
MKKQKTSKFMLAVFMMAVLVVSALSLTACPQDHTHTYGEWTVATDATCTQAGEEERVCSGCDESTEGHKETRPIEAIGHNPIAVSNTATYNSAGIITYECNRNGCQHSYTENSNKLGVPDMMQGTWISYEMFGEMDITISADDVQVLGLEIIAWDGNDGTIEFEGYFDYNDNDQYDEEDDFALDFAVTIAQDGSSLQAVIDDGADEMELEYVKKPETVGENGAIVFADVYQGEWYLLDGSGINPQVNVVISQNAIIIDGTAVTNLAVADVVINDMDMGGYTFTYQDEDVYITRPYDDMFMMVFGDLTSDDVASVQYIRASALTEIDEDYQGEWLSDEDDMGISLTISEYMVTLNILNIFQLTMYEMIEVTDGGYEIYYSDMAMGAMLLNQDGTLTFVMYGETAADNVTYVLSKEQGGGDQGSEGGEEGVLIDDRFVGTWNGLSNMGVGECVVVVTENSITVDGEEATAITAGGTVYGEGYCFTINGVSYELMVVVEGTEEAYILINRGLSQMFMLTKGSIDSGVVIANEFVGTWVGESELGTEYTIVITTEGIIVNGQEATNIQPKDDEFGGFTFVCNSVNYAMDAPMGGGIFLAIGEDDEAFLEKAGIVDASLIGTWFGFDGTTAYNVVIEGNSVTFNDVVATDLQDASTEWYVGITFMVNGVKYGITVYGAEPCIEFYVLNGSNWELDEDKYAFLFEFVGLGSVSFESNYIGTWEGTSEYDSSIEYNVIITANSITINDSAAVSVSNKGGIYEIICANNLIYKVTQFNTFLSVSNVISGDDAYLELSTSGNEPAPSLTINSALIGTWTGTVEGGASYTVVITQSTIAVNGTLATNITVDENYTIGYIFMIDGTQYGINQSRDGSIFFLDLYVMSEGEWAYNDCAELTKSTTPSEPEDPAPGIIDAQYVGTYTGSDYYDISVTRTVEITTSSVTVDGNALTGITVETAADGAAYIIKGATASNSYEITFYMGTANVGVYTNGTMTGYAELTKQGTPSEPEQPTPGVIIDEKYQDYWWHEQAAGDGFYYVLDISAMEIILNVSGPGNPLGTDYIATNITALSEGYSFEANGTTYTMVWGEGKWITLTFGSYTITLQCETSSTPSEPDEPDTPNEPETPSTTITTEYIGTWEGTAVSGNSYRIVITETSISLNGDLADSWMYSDGQYTFYIGEGIYIIYYKSSTQHLGFTNMINWDEVDLTKAA